MNEKDLLEHLTVTKSLLDKDKDDKPIDTITMQYQDRLMASQDWSKTYRNICCTVLYYMTT